MLTLTWLPGGVALPLTWFAQRTEAIGKKDNLCYITAMHTVAILIYDHVNPFELAVATEVFSPGRPELGVEWYQTFVCAGESRPIPTRAGFSIVTSYDLTHLAQANTIIAPSTTPGESAIPDQLLEALRAAYQQGTRVVSFCTGAFVLAAAGLLNGRRAATHWLWSPQLARQYPLVRVDPSVLYVDDGQVLTSAGTAASIDLALYIARKDRSMQASKTFRTWWLRHDVGEKHLKRKELLHPDASYWSCSPCPCL